MPLATLSIDIEAKLAKLEQGMSQATRLVEKNASQMERSFSGIRTAGSAVGGALLAAIPVALVSALVATTRSTLDAVDGFNDLRDATGAGVGNISALDDIARRAGVSFDVAADTLVKFNKQLNDAKPGDDTSRILKSLNLDIEQLRRLDPAEALQKTALALDKYATDGNKARAIQELFGKSVREAAPFLRELAEAGTLNAKVTVEQAQHVKEVNDQLDALQANVTNAARGIVLKFVPALNSLLSTLTSDGLLAALDKFGNSALDWEGSQTRKQIKVLEGDLADLQARASVADGGFLDKIKKLGGAGSLLAIGDTTADIDKQIETKRAQLKKLQAVNFGLTEGLTDGDGGFLNRSDVRSKPALRVPPKTDPGIDKARKAYEELIRTVTERITQQQAESDTGQQLTAAQTFALDTITKLADASARYTDAQKRAVSANLDTLLLLERDNGARKAALEAREKLLDVQRRDGELLDKEADKRLAANAELARYIEEIGLTERQVRALEDARLRETIAQEKQALAVARTRDASDAEAAGMQRNIDLLERQLRLRGEADNKQRSVDGSAGVGVQNAIDAYLEKTGKLAQETERAFGGAIDAVETGLSGLVKTGNSAIDALIAEFFRLNVVRPFLSSLFGLLGGFGGGGASSLGAFMDAFGGARATGGPMAADKWYVAGERGPEIVTGPGNVFNAGQSAAMMGSGGPTIVQYITFNGGVTRNEVISGMVAAKNAALSEWADGARRGRWAGAV
jgi:Lambda phage tail tape-measure protein (Tape_meas_lam_C)